jgi:hypothetical protein
MPTMPPRPPITAPMPPSTTAAPHSAPMPPANIPPEMSQEYWKHFFQFLQQHTPHMARPDASKRPMEVAPHPSMSTGPFPHPPFPGYPNMRPMFPPFMRMASVPPVAPTKKDK